MKQKLNNSSKNPLKPKIIKRKKTNYKKFKNQNSLIRFKGKKLRKIQQNKNKPNK